MPESHFQTCTIMTIHNLPSSQSTNKSLRHSRGCWRNVNMEGLEINKDLGFCIARGHSDRVIKDASLGMARTVNYRHKRNN